MSYYNWSEISFLKKLKDSEFQSVDSLLLTKLHYVDTLLRTMLYIIVLETAQDVENAVPDFETIKSIDCRAVAITAKGIGNFDFYSRYFAPKVGIFEAPVYGSMHYRLVCYWSSVMGKTNFNAYRYYL